MNEGKPSEWVYIEYTHADTIGTSGLMSRWQAEIELRDLRDYPYYMGARVYQAIIICLDPQPVLMHVWQGLSA